MINQFQVIQSHIDRFKSNLNTCIPAKITLINYRGDFISSVDVKPINLKVYKNGEIFNRRDITNVPVVFPSSSKGIVSYPLSVGDHVLLVFPQEDIESFLYDNLSEAIPQTFRKFSLTDAVAIPCIHPTNSNIKAHKDNFQITFNDFTLSVKPSGETSLKTNADVSVEAENASESYTGSYTVDANTVSIGNSTTDLVSYLSDLTDQISKITVGGAPIDNKVEFENLKALIDTLK